MTPQPTARSTALPQTPTENATGQAGLARGPALGVWTLWIAALATSLFALVEALPAGLANDALVGVSMLLVLSTVTVGAVLVTRLPRHMVGWLLFAGGAAYAASNGAAAVADYGLNVNPGTLPGAVWAAVLAQAIGAGWLGLLGGFVPLFFPTGRLPSPRWRIVLPIGAAATAGPVVTGFVSPFTAGTYPVGVTNPLAVGGSAGQVVAVLNGLWVAAGVVALVFVIASLVVRYQRASDIERLQLKWFAAVAIVAITALLVVMVTSPFLVGPLSYVATIGWVATLVGLALLPVAIGIAVLRYRLYEIDRLISRTIAYGLLTLLLGGLFVAVILALQALVAPFTGSNELAVAGSTLLVAALFQPLRRRIQRLVDRRFNRSRYDAERTVAALAARLRDEVDLDAVRADLLATVDATLEPASASLWLRG